jgi:hypothetical protein
VYVCPRVDYILKDHDIIKKLVAGRDEFSGGWLDKSGLGPERPAAYRTDQTLKWRSRRSGDGSIFRNSLLPHFLCFVDEL